MSLKNEGDVNQTIKEGMSSFLFEIEDIAGQLGLDPDECFNFLLRHAKQQATIDSSKIIQFVNRRTNK